MPTPNLGTSQAPKFDFQGLCESIEQPVCFVDNQGQIAFGNRAFSLAFGDGGNQTTGRYFLDLIDSSSLSLALSDLCSEHSRQLPAQTFQRKDGTVFGAGSWSHPFTLANGVRRNLVVFDSVSVDRDDPVESGRAGGELLRQIGNNLDYMFYLLDHTASRFVYVSLACEVFTGRRRREFYSKPSLWSEAVTSDCDASFATRQSELENGREVLCEYKLQHSNGRVRWIKDHVTPVRDPSGTVRMFAGVAEDVTSFHEAQELLVERERKFQRILTGLPDVTWTADRQGSYSYISPRVERILGYSNHQIYAARPGFLHSRIHPEDKDRVHHAYAALFDEKKIFDEEYRIASKNGDWIWIHDRAVSTHGENSTLYTDGVFNDVSDRKTAEANLQSKTAFLEALVNSTMDGILVVDGDGKVLLANQRMLDLFEIPESLHHSRLDQSMLQHAVAMVKDGDAFLQRVQYLYAHPEMCGRDIIEFRNGAILDRDTSPVVGEGGKYYGRIWVFRDITESKSRDDMLQQLSLAVEQSSVSVIITDPAGKISYVNRKFTDSSGYSIDEVLGKNPNILNSGYSPAEFYKELWSTISQGKEWRGEFRNRRKNGELYWESATITPVTGHAEKITHYLAIKEDVTERRLLEGQLRQAQKLEAIGQLAAGIAHEINTPTQFVMDNLAFLKESWEAAWRLIGLYRDLLQPGQNPPAEKFAALGAAERECDLEFLTTEVPRAIDAGLDGVRRVSKIVRAMKEFSHPDSGDKTMTDLNRSIESTITVARNEWKYVATVEQNLDPNLPLVLCFPGEINQVILNLLVNAAHAIKEKIKEGEKGQITVSTHLRGDFAELSVSDTGGGIPDNIRMRIFEPFFTTKEVGKGTGQGLALAHNVVVKKLGGRIWFETEVGRGTTFYVHLPVNAVD